MGCALPSGALARRSAIAGRGNCLNAERGYTVLEREAQSNCRSTIAD